MLSASAPSLNTVLRNLPSVDELLRSLSVNDISIDAGEGYAAALIRDVIGELRREIVERTELGHSKKELLATAETRLRKKWCAEQLTGMHRVINATGVVIHTNLGRAPLSEKARQAVANEASGYCTLEYDIETGKRGKRGRRAENLLAEITGAESVLIVNNCAAAAYFVLTAFAAGGEVIISRGELVEIGGDFRVPDVLAQSGASLCEVGTTNRTKLSDYENAVTENTRLILRVHPSNYRIVGFTATPSLIDLVDLAHRNSILLYEDLGSGSLLDLGVLGLTDEPVVGQSVTAGVDIVTFSGDKLLGGPQAGIIAGKATLIDRLRTHPLYRALRVDKLTYAALEATLQSYRRNAAFVEIPVLQMLSMEKTEIEKRAETFVAFLRNRFSLDGNGFEMTELEIELSDGFSAIGGGAAPAVSLPTKLIALSHKKLSVARIERVLRTAETPVITRIFDDRVMIDLRTVSEDEMATLGEIIVRSFGQNPA